MAETDIPVLIVGGSLVGLSAAALLAQHGIESLTVERHSGTAIHPRAAAATQRTMEIFRHLGLEAAIRERSARQFVQDGGIVAVETLLGGATREFIADLNAGVRDVSPCERIFLSQNSLEPLLAARATELGATLRFSTEVVSIAEHPSNVTITLRDRGTQQLATVSARYVLAADGTHSSVRTRLGIGMRGHAPFSRSVTIYFRANMRPLLKDRQWSVVYVNNARLRGFFRFEKPFDSAFLVVNTLGDPSRPITDVSTGLTNEGARELVASALGTDDIPVTVDAVMHWEAAAQVAEKIQTGRVFIVGDAAHVMPPTGGFGGNTGVQDAHNIAWKLALVLRGSASPDLLKTYESERLPVARFTAEQAYTRYVLRTDPSLGTQQCQPLVEDLCIELGYGYSDAAPLYMSPRESHGRPGTRAPHFWLNKQGQRVSSVDLYGRGFVLLSGPSGDHWCQCAQTVAADLGIDLDVIRPGAGDIDDPDGKLRELHDIEADGCLLIRPDGFVGWRARNARNASTSELTSTLLQLLGRA